MRHFLYFCFFDEFFTFLTLKVSLYNGLNRSLLADFAAEYNAPVEPIVLLQLKTFSYWILLHEMLNDDFKEFSVVLKILVVPGGLYIDRELYCSLLIWNKDRGAYIWDFLITIALKVWNLLFLSFPFCFFCLKFSLIFCIYIVFPLVFSLVV